jgi:hypothetical protein
MSIIRRPSRRFTIPEGWRETATGVYSRFSIRYQFDPERYYDEHTSWT